jgi:hypothetical protein
MTGPSSRRCCRHHVRRVPDDRDDVAVRRHPEPLLGDGHQHRRVDLGHGSGDPDGRQHHPAAGLRARRGAQHPGRQICRAAVFRRGAAEAARRHVTRPPTSSASTTPACSAGRACCRATSRTSTARTPSSRSRIRSSTSSRTRRIGTEFELNDHRGVIVGIAKVASSGLFGVPTLYTTYNRALQYIPNTRFTISYILVEPKTPPTSRRSSSRSRAPAIWRSPRTSSSARSPTSTNSRPASAPTC